VTGDTVYAIASASSAAGLTALGNELVPAGTIASASSLALDSAGDLYVGDAVGGGAGSVIKISGGVATAFASGLEFTGGIAIDAAGDVFVSESLVSFENQIRRYDSTGTPLGVVAGPSFGFGSLGLALDGAGDLIATGLFGGDVVRVDPSDGAESALFSGFTFATGVERDAFTQRVQLLSSTFSGDPEDSRLHRLVPIAALVAGNGSTKTECVHEMYGVELVPAKPGKKAKQAICVDGAPCDADGTVNDLCTYPVGFCVNVPDPTFVDCTPSDVAIFELKKAKPESATITATAAAVQAAAPVSAATCFFSDGFEVPLKIAKNGAKKAGKGKLKLKATTGDAKARKDGDAVKFVCRPSPL
jgi:hypothetical protein